MSMSKFTDLLAWVDEEKRAEEVPMHERHADIFVNTPLFSAAVDKFVHSQLPKTETASGLIPHYGLLGIREEPTTGSASAEDRLVLSNMNMPWSAFICGSQGAGKSHTLSCLLENALLVNHASTEKPNLLTAMVMHYDRYASHNSSQVCEAAYLCSSGIPVTVLVSPSNIWAMHRLYSNLPGLPPASPPPKVFPLYLDEDQLDISRILRLMAVNPDSKNPPLYMEVIMNLVRGMAMTGRRFTYSKFRAELDKIKWLQGQKGPLALRLQLLDTMIKPSSKTATPRPAPAPEDIWAFKPGTLTIIDLSDPFLGSDDACTLFSICLSIFLENRSKCGRVVVLDEAHKFLTQTGEAQILTDDLLSIIRQQRHTGTRVIIATQEPTLSPSLLDLSNATFVHRFVSPSWYEMLKRHLAGADKLDRGGTNVLFETIVGLQTGEALLFCPTAQIDTRQAEDNSEQTMKPLGDSYVRLKIRKRITSDGGKSIMASDVSADVPVHKPVGGVPMFGGPGEPKKRLFRYQIRMKQENKGKKKKKKGKKKA
ncbi:hypothetical protein GGS23DRAFT_604766 [Durotheca rogersii]|uniref:uncharacterized protein n=1 Tax=Durotheca rogersii TaxID=419775 RepID=UPI00221ECC9E|nr:uncharacterized protein GGS23DRAFT_604766 [Durotheca rogersii]KAI5863762.1 hypothetical protein GGS23DRAFT_604766 [Durotheca rogersii]